ncbi:sensor histidine kinase [Tsukamurella sp. 8F]|uniref:sensor histidine kinase n=1 Tax=unclassified Tsukamurella TaxID=2633480 RepID=UPI0023B92782|nr:MULTISPECIES: sensor histidine kinase [unclassified Tsukamurella]MDF0530419.1 sensor histidine kinase [Tsukamurella sp. 8J]MDF0587760.1 sensor histidine kinase [Tsukamurella sp. 8F]
MTVTEYLKAWRDPRWVFGAVWLMFLASPLAAVLGSHSLSRPARWAGVTLLLAFALGYAAMCVHVMMPAMRGVRFPPARIAAWSLPLVAIAAGLIPILGQSVMGMGGYLMALIIFQFPPLTAAVLVLAMLGAVALLPEVVPGWSPDPSTTILLVTIGVVLLVTRTMQAREQDREAAVERRRALQEQLAVIAERERVARDVHDILGHSLTVMALKSELAARLVDEHPERAKAEIIELHTLSRAALSEVRATVGNLRAPDLRDELRSARTALDAAEIRAEVSEADDASDDTVPDDSSVLAWVLREAVTNVVRHSGAASCRIELGHNSIEIIDDGCGLRGGFGHGLRGLDERVRDAGGVLEVSSPGGPGTRVRASLP